MGKPEELDFAAQAAEQELDTLRQDYDGVIMDYIYNNHHLGVIRMEEKPCNKPSDNK